jgi:hypothetical protein
MSTSSPVNPYEPPRESAPPANKFSDQDAEAVAELRKRVDELEKRVGRSWVVHKNVFLRICGVWGYWLLGYALIAALGYGGAFFVIFVIWLITGRWPW